MQCTTQLSLECKALLPQSSFKHCKLVVRVYGIVIRSGAVRARSSSALVSYHVLDNCCDRRLLSLTQQPLLPINNISVYLYLRASTSGRGYHALHNCSVAQSVLPSTYKLDVLVGPTDRGYCEQWAALDRLKHERSYLTSQSVLARGELAAPFVRRSPSLQLKSPVDGIAYTDCHGLTLKLNSLASCCASVHAGCLVAFKLVASRHCANAIYGIAAARSLARAV